MAEFRLPELGENIEAGDIVKIAVKAGDQIQKDQIVLELETDKAVVEVPSDQDGIVKTVHVKEGAKAKVGQVILTLEGPSKITPISTAKKITPPEPEKPRRIKSRDLPEKDHGLFTKVLTSPPSKEKAEILAAPFVRKLAREIGVDLSQIQGSGPRGRILEEDVKKSARTQKISSPSPMILKSEKLPEFSQWGETETKPMTSVRRKTAERLSQAWITIPHVTQTDEADITELEEIRKKYGKRAEEAGGNLTFTSILLKIIADALKVYPQFNASIDVSSQEIIYKKYYHIGVAVDTDRGLLVPVIRNVDKKNIIQLSIELNEAASRARDRKTSLEDLEGATFTVTNLGGIGGGHFTPIINPPNVAILGVGRWKIQPVYEQGAFLPRKILPLSLSYDHRLIDGADAARFLRWLVDAVKQPSLIELEG